MKGKILVVLLLLTALGVGLVLPRAMTAAQSAMAQPPVAHAVDTVSLSYSRELSVVEKYQLVRGWTSVVAVLAGHTNTEEQALAQAEIFVRTAFPTATLKYGAAEPVLAVCEDQLLTGWNYTADLYWGDAQTNLGLFLDDATGMVLVLHLTAAQPLLELIPPAQTLEDLGAALANSAAVTVEVAAWEDSMLGTAQGRDAPITMEAVYTIWSGQASCEVPLVVFEDTLSLNYY